MKNLLILFLLLGTLTCSEISTGTEDHSSLLPINNEVVIDLNHLAYSIANEHDQFYSFIGVRALTMVHLAIHDILNAISPKHEAYLFDVSVKDVDPIAAVVESTRSILTSAYTKRTDTINLVCNNWLEIVPKGPKKVAGISLGKAVAAAYIQHRQNDGHEKNGDYTPMTKPGDYQYTPEFDWVWKPDFSVARPFTLDSLNQFRSPVPPDMSSELYLNSFEEVKAYGGKLSTLRSEDQRNFGHWWAEFGEHSWNRIGRISAVERNLPISETARMFALINMNLYDLYLVSMESKYHYDTWRPYTAIRKADRDGNPATKADKNWEPDMLTPPWPEYPSAHAAVGASGAEIISEVYGTNEVSFTMTSVTALPNSKERTYTNLDKAANDCADSRIMNGYHFRFATEEGKRQGRRMAKHTIANFLKPLAIGNQNK